VEVIDFAAFLDSVRYPAELVAVEEEEEEEQPEEKRRKYRREKKEALDIKPATTRSSILICIH